MTRLPPGYRASAQLSECGAYRYRLDRSWQHQPTLDQPEPLTGTVTWVMLNPSTADAEKEDSTITRCRTFVEDWGYTALTVVNLYAWRATDPATLTTVDDPVGPRNHQTVRQAINQAAIVVCAWGAHAQPAAIQRLVECATNDGIDLYALGLTRDGQPRHPLYLPRTATPSPWSPPSHLCDASTTI